MLGCGLFHYFQARPSCISVSWLLIVFVGLTEDQFVVAEPEGVPIQRHRVQVHVTVVALGLTD